MSQHQTRISLITRNKSQAKTWIRTLKLSLLVPSLCCYLLVGIAFSAYNLKSSNRVIVLLEKSERSTSFIHDIDVRTHRIVKRQFSLQEAGNDGRRFDPVPVSRLAQPEEERPDVITGSGGDAPGSSNGRGAHFINQSLLEQIYALRNNNSAFQAAQNDSNAFGVNFYPSRGPAVPPHRPFWGPSPPRTTQPPTVYPRRTEPFTFPTEPGLFNLDSIMGEGGIGGRPTYANTNQPSGSNLFPTHSTVITSRPETMSRPQSTVAASTEVVSTSSAETLATLETSTSLVGSPTTVPSSTLFISSPTTKRSGTTTSQPPTSVIQSRTTESQGPLITAQDEKTTSIPETKPNNPETVSNQPAVTTNKPNSANQVESTTNQPETVTNKPLTTTSTSQPKTVSNQLETTTEKPVTASNPPKESTTANQHPPISVAEPSPPLPDYATASPPSQTDPVTSSNRPRGEVSNAHIHQLRQRLALAIVLPLLLMSLVVAVAFAWVIALKPKWDRNRRVGIVSQPVVNGNGHNHRTPGSGSSDISSRESIKHNGTEMCNEAWPENGRMVTPNPA